MIPLMLPQRQIYEVEQFYGGAVGRLYGGVLLDAVYPVEQLCAALETLRRENDALRLHIEESADGPVQYAEPYVPGRVEALRFSDRAEMEAFAAAWTREPFSPEGPLSDLRAVILPGRCGAIVKLDHMLGDEWAYLLLVKQFCALLRGETPEYGAYLACADREAAYLRSARAEADRQAALAQFRERGESVLLSERPEGGAASARAVFSVGGQNAALLRTRAAEWGVSPFALFLTAFAVYVSRIRMNAERFYLGTEVRNRATAAEKRTVGMFANTVPLPVELSYGRSFRENAEGMRDALTGLLRRQRFNYALARQTLRREFGFEGRLFDAVLSYQPADAGLENAETFWDSSGSQSEALFLRIYPGEGSAFSLVYDYQTAKFTGAEIETVHRRLLRLLSDGLEHGEKRPAGLELLDGEERRTLARFNDTVSETPLDECIHTRIERLAAQSPDAPALTDRDGTLTRAALNAMANRAARALMARDVGRGDFVALSLPRDRRLVAAILGILKTGAAYLPVDPDFPPERIDYMLRESRAKAYLRAEDTDALFAGEDAEDPGVAVDPDSPCYAIYTSGSTGRPKGALMSHRGISTLMSPSRCNPVPTRMARGDVVRVVSVGSVVFDLFGAETLLPLSLGLETLLADGEQSRSQRALSELLAGCPAQAMLVTPTKLKSLMGDPAQRDYLRKMRMLVLGGEAVEPDLVETLSRLTRAELYNVYGPAEAMWSTSGRIRGPGDVTIGGPLANTQIHITDRFCNEVPPGVTGEICVAGDVVGPGYLNNPEKTAERFLPNPFGPGTLYRTGDLGRWRSDGRVDFLGRNDFQVKLKGIRVEPGEIELALRTLPGVREAVAAVRTDPQGRQVLCAYYTGSTLSGSYLRRALGAMLPRHMVPQRYTHLDALPLTASGKLDRLSLPEPEMGSQDRPAYAAPVGAMEELVCTAMAEAMGLPRVGRDDDFFDLGGDSLRVIDLHTRLERAGCRLLLRTLLEQPTPRALAAALEQAGYTAPAP